MLAERAERLLADTDARTQPWQRNTGWWRAIRSARGLKTWWRG